MIADYDDLIRDAATNHLPEGYDWRLYKAQLWQESRLKPDAESPAGALGIAQFMPNTWIGWTMFQDASPFDPEAAIPTGAKYMAWLIKQWSWPRPTIDRYCLAMASYNAGLKHILDAQVAANDATLYADIIHELPNVTNRTKSREAIGYVREILNFWVTEVIR